MDKNKKCGNKNLEVFRAKIELKVEVTNEDLLKDLINKTQDVDIKINPKGFENN